MSVAPTIEKGHCLNILFTIVVQMWTEIGAQNTNLIDNQCIWRAKNNYSDSNSEKGWLWQSNGVK